MYIYMGFDYIHCKFGFKTQCSVYKMVLRLIMYVPNLTHSALLFHQCGVMPIYNRIKFRTVTTVYKSLNGLTPEIHEEHV